MEYSATNLKADQFTFPVLELFSSERDDIAREVGEKIGQSPEFFHNTPVVLDLKSLGEGETELAQLIELLRSFGLNPVAVRGCNELHRASAIALDLAVLADERKRPIRSQQQPVAEPEPAPAPLVENVVSTRPVRSGQKLAASRGDLTLIASTGPGSELIASGNIHVYGTLRGRAIAGARGDENCRIFCQRLDAELVSIAGAYRVSEDIDEKFRRQPVQIFLSGERLQIELLADIA